MADEGLTALMPIILIFAALIMCAILWCMLSSCMGTPILRSISNLWKHTIVGMSTSGLAPRRRAGIGEQELWEMEYRGRAG